MKWTLLLLATLANPNTAGYVHDRFDLVEINHYHNEFCQSVFDQLIFWDWDPVGCRFSCQGWQMMHGSRDKSDAVHRQSVEGSLEAARRGRPHSQGPPRKYAGKFVGGPMMPARNHRLRLYEIRYLDGEVYRRITATLFRETWTQHDPERVDNKLYGSDHRRGLTMRKRP